MDFTNFFFGQRKDEPEYQIGNSLRFRKEVPNYLTNTDLVGSLGDYTISVWVKKGFEDEDGSKFIITSGTAGTTGSQLGYNNGGTLPAFNFVEMGGNTATSQNYRHTDPHGWYHLVATNQNGPGAAGAVDGPKQTLFVNGEKVGTASGTGSINLFSQSPVQIGLYADPSYLDTAWEGYMADFFFIDGKALPPTVFGGYDGNGVWKPVDPQFEVNTTKYSAGVVGGPSGVWYAGTTLPKTMFDGDLSTYCQTTEAVGTITWTPIEPIPYTTSVRVNAIGSDGDAVSFNDGPLVAYGDGSGFAWRDIPNLPAGPGLIHKIEWRGGYGGTVAAIEVDGVVLIDGPRYSDDLYAVNDGTVSAPPFDTALKEFNPSGPRTVATMAFDGDAGTYAGCANPGSWVVYRPSTPIQVNSKIKFQGNFGISDAYINDLAGQIDITGTQEVFEVDFTGELTHIAVRGLPGNFAGTLQYIEIDGSPLLDGVGLDFGNKGFHLDFSDPSDIGKDVSGNGNNFTPNGFDTTLETNGYWVDSVPNFVNGTIPNSQGQPYVIDVDPANGPVGYNYPTNDWVNLFDGRLDTNAMYWPSLTENGGTEFTFDLRDYGTIESFEFYAYNWLPSGIPDFTVEFLDSNKVAIAGTQRSAGGLASEPQTNDWRSMQVLGDPKYIRFFRTTSSDHLQMRAFRINGAILDQSGSPDYTYDVMLDSPTNNFATFDNLLTDTQPYYLNPDQMEYAMLSGSTSSGVYKSFRGTILPEQDCYWEVYYGSTPSSATYSGLGTNTTDMGNTTEGWWGYNTANGSSGSYVVDGQGSAGGTDPIFAVGDVAGFYWNYDADQLTMYKNGVEIRSQMDTSGRAGRDLYIHHRPYGGDTFFINFGQQGYVHFPEGIGTREQLKLCTNNLATSSIADGRDHFRALNGIGAGGGATGGDITGSFSSYLQCSQEGFDASRPAYRAFNNDGTDAAQSGFANRTITWTPQPAFSWNSQLRVLSVKNNNRARINGGAWVDLTANSFTTVASSAGTINTLEIESSGGNTVSLGGIEADGNLLVDDTILQSAQETFPNGLWWIKPRVSDSVYNNHQLVDSVRGADVQLGSNISDSETSYVVPGDECVAWCWNSGSPAVANNNGSIPSQVSVNAEAGFSIVTYTGNLTAGATVGHGLGAVPACMIVKDRDDGSDWHVYHQDLAANHSLLLNTTGAEANYNAWGGSPPAENIIYLGPVDGTNKAGNGFVAYCWAEVPGYSKFGTYKGTGYQDGNGPFAYCGFEPAVIIFKRTSGAGGDWLIFDNERNPENTQNQAVALYPNSDEVEGGGYKIDFLSNGFKVRGSEAQWNDANGADYVFFAWAKSPFQAPTPARR